MHKDIIGGCQQVLSDSVNFICVRLFLLISGVTLGVKQGVLRYSRQKAVRAS